MTQFATNPPDPAEQIFLDWWYRSSAGTRISLDDLCAAHPQFAERLRQLAASLAAGSPKVQPATPAGPALPEPYLALLDRLEERARAGPRFRIGKRIGVGGMGEVHEAFDDDLGRELVVKWIRGSAPRATPPDELLRFCAEAQITGQLQHPGIVAVHEIGLLDDGRLFFAMQKIPGATLDEVIGRVHRRHENWPQRRVLEVLLRICDAMSYAHSQGVIHRDLKPTNVLVGEFGEAHVVDWGLAKVLARPGVTTPHTVRTHHPASTSPAAPTATTAAPLQTLPGTVLGTPEFMAPEAAAGNLDLIDERADVYAVGAMLYQLLTNRVPYAEYREETAERRVARVQHGPPTSVRKLARHAHADLLAICERAMARDPARRYASMPELGGDLRAHLETRVVTARRSLRVRIGKWARRNPWLTGVTAASAVAMAAASLLLQSLSSSVVTYAAELDTERATRHRFSVLMQLEGLRIEAASLWPATPGRIADLERWLTSAQSLIDGAPANPTTGEAAVDGLQAFRRQLDTIRARARPLTVGELQEDQRRHPLFHRLQHLERQHAWYQRMLRDAPWPPPMTPAEAGKDLPRPEDVASLLEESKLRGDPDRGPFGEEQRALALALEALRLATPETRAPVLVAVAFARTKCGDLAGAEQALADAALAITDANRRAVEAEVGYCRQRIEKWRPERAGDRRRELAYIAEELLRVRQDVLPRRTYRFDEPDDQVAHDTLARLVSGLEDLNHPTRGQLTDKILDDVGPSVAARLRMAKTVTDRTTTGSPAAENWQIAIQAVRTSPLYGGLVLTPQLGLRPLGVDPKSGFWLFVVDATGGRPQPLAEGGWAPTPTSGIVLALVPGGTFQAGAQKDVPGAPNYDPYCTREEQPVREVVVGPFFLSKYEMTQHQWHQVSGSWPSNFRSGHYFDNWNADRKPWQPSFPVESVSYDDCEQVLRRIELTLPTSDQWEYAYRAGTDTPWPTGSDKRTLRGHANLCDQFAAEFGSRPFEDWLDDHNVVTTTVGYYLPNPWGFHDMAGNVSEWMLDRGAGPNGDGRVRGGNYSLMADIARSAHVQVAPPTTRHQCVGVRPARALQR